MSSAKYLFRNPHLQAAANLRTGVFRPAAAPQVETVLEPPETLPKPKYPQPDNTLLIEYPALTRIIVQREGLGFILQHTATRNILTFRNTFTLSQVVDPKNRTLHEREMTTGEARYALALVEKYFGPNECSRLQKPLDALRASLPPTLYPTKKAELNEEGNCYVFNRYGYQYTVGVDGHKFMAGYINAQTGRFDSRDMRRDEIELAIHAISRAFTLEQSIKYSDLIRMMRETHESFDNGGPSP